MIVFASEDTIVLKKLHQAKLTDSARRARGKPRPMREILGEIQKHRQELGRRA